MKYLIILLLFASVTLAQDGVEARQMNVIICANEAEFNSLNARIHAAMERDVPRYNAVRWANPIRNAKDERQIAFPVKDRIEKYLTGSERARKIELPREWKPEEGAQPAPEGNK